MKDRIERLTQERFEDFFALVCALADYEQLARPDDTARQRLFGDLFGQKPRIEAFLAFDASSAAVGYAIILETYSSFLALPTLYLEDLFVLEEHRSKGHGAALFDIVVAEARHRGCGRVDWQVLDWNTLARDFYARRGAECLDEWKLYRITL